MLASQMNTKTMTFLLPNRPTLPQGVSSYDAVPANVVIELNGNHWRKILTIIAKLVTVAEEDWRIVRDQSLWDRVKLIFDPDEASEGWLVIVGKQFHDDFPIPAEAEAIGARHTAHIHQKRIWCPYLDYRQFPNVLVDELVTRIRK